MPLQQKLRSRRHLSSDLLTVSNNQLVWQDCASACIWITGQVVDVLYKCLDLLSRGYCLYTHPIAGNARLLHNPYRTVIMRRRRCADDRIRRDIRTIDYFLRKLEEQQGSSPAKAHLDYRLVDYELYLAMRPIDLNSG